MKTVKTIFITIELFQGVINEVHAYSVPKEADQAEYCWLRESKITSDEDREIQSKNGIEFHVYECALDFEI